MLLEVHLNDRLLLSIYSKLTEEELLLYLHSLYTPSRHGA
jgi:hypothetical protein